MTYKWPYLMAVELWNVEYTVCLVIYETEEITPDFCFSNQTQFDLESMNGI